MESRGRPTEGVDWVLGERQVHPWLSSKKGKLCKRVWFLDDSAAEVELETDVLEVLEGLGVKQQMIRDSMTGQNQHNYVSTSYFLLLTKRSSEDKQRRERVKNSPSPNKPSRKRFSPSPTTAKKSQ